MVPMPESADDMLEGTPLKGGRLPDHESEDLNINDDKQVAMVPLIERLNHMVRLNII